MLVFFLSQFTKYANCPYEVSFFLLLSSFIAFIVFFSDTYERLQLKEDKFYWDIKVNKIADYEALHHIKLWPSEPEPKYIYYIGQFTEWYESRKDDQDAIYKDIEKRFHIFKTYFYRRRL